MGVETWPEATWHAGPAGLRSNVCTVGIFPAPTNGPQAGTSPHCHQKTNPCVPMGSSLSHCPPLPHSPRGKGPRGVPCPVLILQRETEALEDTRLAEGPRPGRAEPGGTCWFPDSQHRSGPHPGGLSQGSRSPQDGLSPLNPASRSTQAAGTTARTSRNRSLGTEELRGLGCVLSVGSSPLKHNPSAFRDPLGRHCHLTPGDWRRQSVTKTRPVSRVGSETPALGGRRSKNFCRYF